MHSLNKAIVLYLGHGITTYPVSDASRLAQCFSAQEASGLAEQVNVLLDELDAIKPDWNAHTLVSGSQWAVAQLKRSHPELDDKATAALEWAYSWWWK
jgi:hypothetical protein